MATLAAGLCSAKFNHHCRLLREAALSTNPTDTVFWTRTSENAVKFDRLMEALDEARAFFDARVFNVDSNDDILWNIMWRSNYDCCRNSKTNLGRAYFSAKHMEGISSKGVVEKLLAEKQVDWSTWPAAFRYGTFIKRALVEKDGFNPMSKEQTKVKRTVMERKDFGVPTFAKEFVDMLLIRYWNDVPEETLKKLII